MKRNIQHKRKVKRKWRKEGLTCSLRACMDVNSICSLFFRTQAGSSGISTAINNFTKISRCCKPKIKNKATKTKNYSNFIFFYFNTER